VVEGTLVSPRIAALHAAGVMRGAGGAGETLSKLHEAAESLGKTEVVLLAVALGLLVTAAFPAPIRGVTGSVQ
jgi:fructose-specific phosphotransferase system IIC component